MGISKRGYRSFRRPTLKTKKIKTLKKLALALVIALLAAYVYHEAQPNTYDAKQRVKLEATIQQLQVNKDQLLIQTKQQQQQSAQDKAKLDEINKKLQETEKQLQAKRSAPTVYAAAAPTPQTSGNCETWLAQAGIPNTPAVRALIQGESGCNPNSVNSSSGACGIAQELPCGKSGCGLGNAVCQLRWMDSYVKGRYGSWEGAYSTWLSRSPHWY